LGALVAFGAWTVYRKWANAKRTEDFLAKTGLSNPSVSHLQSAAIDPRLGLSSSAQVAIRGAVAQSLYGSGPVSTTSPAPPEVPRSGDASEIGTPSLDPGLPGARF
jgi:hypothetical protein